MTKIGEFAEIRSILEKYNRTLELNKEKEADLDQFNNDFTEVGKTIIGPT